MISEGRRFLLYSIFKLIIVELLIFAVLCEEGIVVSALDDASLFQHHDHVGVSHGGKSVRDNKAGFVSSFAGLKYIFFP